MPLPRHQHVPSFQVTSQANPTCRPRLPAVPLPARPGGPAKLGTELGPADAHLSPPAAPCPISLEWKRWSDATPLPCTSGRKPVRVNPRLGPVPREQDKAEHAQDPHQHPWYGSLPPPNNRPRDNSLEVAPGRGVAPLPGTPARSGRRACAPQGSSRGSWTGAAAPRRSLARTPPVARAGSCVGFSSDVSSAPSLSRQRGEQGPALQGGC